MITRRARQAEISVFSAAARGAMSHGTAGQRTASGRGEAHATTILAFVLSGKWNSPLAIEIALDELFEFSRFKDTHLFLFFL